MPVGLFAYLTSPPITHTADTSPSSSDVTSFYMLGHWLFACVSLVSVCVMAIVWATKVPVDRTSLSPAFATYLLMSFIHTTALLVGVPVVVAPIQVRTRHCCVNLLCVPSRFHAGIP